MPYGMRNGRTAGSQRRASNRGLYGRLAAAGEQPGAASSVPYYAPAPWAFQHAAAVDATVRRHRLATADWRSASWLG